MARTSSMIENTIAQIEDLVGSSKPVLLSSRYVKVDREELEALIKQLRVNIPEEVERYRKVISNKEAIERSAQEDADRLMSQVRQQANDILSENEITAQAQRRADDIMAMAAEEADRIVAEAQYQGDAYMASAQNYLSDMLQNLNSIIYDCIENTTRNTDRFLEALNGVGQTVQENLNELNAPPEEPAAPAPGPEERPSIFENAGEGGEEE
ncbi:MAG: hypothetical protein K6E50_09595 [Lachnospiraceae bacterium]|nr:hypothetical protein [Lachnospiraceae bacterium]